MSAKPWSLCCACAVKGLAIVAVSICAPDRAPAAAPGNAQSPLGINLLQVTYYSAEQPFLNIFKTAAVSQATSTGWITHADLTWDTHEEAYLQLDKDGYPRTLKANVTDPNTPQLFNSVGVLLLRNLPRANAGSGSSYRPGRYVVLYDGEGALSFGFDARLVKSSPGRGSSTSTISSGAP